jgi:hypothetical protein
LKVKQPGIRRKIMALVAALGALVAGACILAALRSKRNRGTRRVETLEFN